MSTERYRKSATRRWKGLNLRYSHRFCASFPLLDLPHPSLSSLHVKRFAPTSWGSCNKTKRLQRTHDVGKKAKDKKSPTSRWNPCSIGVSFSRRKNPRRLLKSRREYGVQGEPLLRFLGGVLCRIAKNAHYDKQRIFYFHRNRCLNRNI